MAVLVNSTYSLLAGVVSGSKKLMVFVLSKVSWEHSMGTPKSTQDRTQIIYILYSIYIYILVTDSHIVSISMPGIALINTWNSSN